jgi:hypothetical protein
MGNRLFCGMRCFKVCKTLAQVCHVIFALAQIGLGLSDCGLRSCCAGGKQLTVQ